MFRLEKDALCLGTDVMYDLDAILERNPKAAKGYEQVQQTIGLLDDLRAAGIAKGDQLSLLRRDLRSNVRYRSDNSRSEIPTK